MTLSTCLLPSTPPFEAQIQSLLNQQNAKSAKIIEIEIFILIPLIPESSF